MNVEDLKRIIKEHTVGRGEYLNQCSIAERYYRNDNDILYKPSKLEGGTSTRNADNRIPSNFHSLLVNQKTAYLFTAPPLFDVRDEEINKKITEMLGDDYVSTCSRLCVDASNKAVGWLHYWVSAVKGFQYSPVEPEQIIPIYSSKLKGGLEAVIRNYTDRDQQGRKVVIWEYWTAEDCTSFVQTGNVLESGALEEWHMFSYDGIDGGMTNRYLHGLGEIPFIPFYNNTIFTNDLQNIKGLVDSYDKVFSGFLNDLEDIQEVIFVLTNYGGEGDGLDEFLRKLGQYKVVQIEGAGADDKSGLETISIDIPVEARKAFLERTRKAIFEQGQGVDPNPAKFGGASGEALKFLYSLLELKAGYTEAGFRPGFGRLVRAMCRYLGYRCRQVEQTWTRTAIANDRELAEISKMSHGLISRKSILKYHPNVDDVDEELEQLSKEKEEREQAEDVRNEMF